MQQWVLRYSSLKHTFLNWPIIGIAKHAHEEEEEEEEGEEEEEEGFETEIGWRKLCFT